MTAAPSPPDRLPQGRVRRRPGRNARDLSLHAPVVPRKLVNRWAPLEVLSQDGLLAIMEGAYQILEEAGLEFRSERALGVLRAHGADVDSASQMVRMDRGLVQAYCAKAPASFVLHSRNPDKAVHFGGNVINFSSANGAPNVSDAGGGRRFGDYRALCDIVKLNYALGAIHLSGGEVVEPIDVPVRLRPVKMVYAHIKYGDLVWSARGLGREPVMDAVAMAAMSRGISLEQLAEQPSFYVVTNTNSPRRVDEELVEGAMTAAEYGQAVCVTPFTLAGAMAPITLAGALALQTAEAMGVIALVQMVRPGAPVIYGGFTSNVDMRSGSPAFGTPEYVRATLAGGQIARHLKLPYRTSSPNSSCCVDAQSTYETAFALQAAIMAHGNLVNHASGWLEGGLTSSFEKIVVDTEMLRGWAESMRKLDVSTEDLAVDAIKAVPPGGHFFGSPHTMARFEHAFYRPMLSDWRNFETWQEDGSRTATQRASDVWRKALAEYVAPPLDEAVDEALQDFVASRAAAFGEAA